MVEFGDAEGEPNLGDDLILEFKSENLSGIVRLNRVEETNPSELSWNRKKHRHGKGKTSKNYDEKGAMYFAVSVVSLYGLSIGVLVAFSLRKDWDEDEVKNFQRSWVKMDHMMEKQEKQRAKRMMTRAIIAIHQPRRTSVCAAVTRDAVYMALAPVALAAPSAAGTERRPSREIPIWNNLPPPMVTIEEGSAGTPVGGATCGAEGGEGDEVDRGNNCPNDSGCRSVSSDEDTDRNRNSTDIDDEPEVEADGSFGIETSSTVSDRPARGEEDDEEEVGQLEEHLLEGQLEDDLDMGSDAIGSEDDVFVHVGDDVVGSRINLGLTRRSRDSPPSLASPEVDDDLDDDVFLISPITLASRPANQNLPDEGINPGGITSPVLPYMDEDPSPSWADPQPPLGWSAASERY